MKYKDTINGACDTLKMSASHSQEHGRAFFGMIKGRNKSQRALPQAKCTPQLQGEVHWKGDRTQRGGHRVSKTQEPEDMKGSKIRAVNITNVP